MNDELDLVAAANQFKTAPIILFGLVINWRCTLARCSGKAGVFFEAN